MEDIVLDTPMFSDVVFGVTLFQKIFRLNNWDS